MPMIRKNTFYNVDRSIPVYIPLNSKERYQQAPYWEEFFNLIEPAPATSVEDTYSTSHDAKNADFNAKKVLNNNQLFILRGGKIYNIQGAKIN